MFIFFSDVDSEATEGNTENEQEDARPSTGQVKQLCYRRQNLGFRASWLSVS